MQRVDGGNLEDAERCDRIGCVKLLRKLCDAVHLVRLAHSNACLRNPECRRHEFRHHGCERTAADEHDRLRRIAIQLQDLLCNRIRQMFDPRSYGGDDLLGGKRELHAEDVGEGHVLPVCRLAFDLLGDVEVEQVFA